MTWALKRQIVYVAILIVFFLACGVVIIYPSLHKPPTCTDNKQDGTETGIDCGGSCTTACLSQVDKISVLWSQAFEVVPGRYNAVAYLENHNSSDAVEKISYRFRFADANNIYIGKREGVTIVPPAGKFAVFEPGIDIGNSIPVYTTFEFTSDPVWLQVPQDKLNQIKVFVSGVDLENEDTSPTLSATLKNNSLFTIPDVNVVAILYDEKGNAVSASRTYLDSLAGQGEAQVNFTWPEPLPAKVLTKEIIPIFDIFAAKLK